MVAALLATGEVAHGQWPLGGQMPKPAKPAAAQHVTATGRFQVFVSPHIKGKTFMLDSDTGRVWIVQKDHATGTYSLKRVPVEEVDSEQTTAGESPGKDSARKNQETGNDGDGQQVSDPDRLQSGDQ
jgi:hypothetical protein